MDFTDRTFLVTGGSSGLGKATTAKFLDRGAHVVVADLNDDAPDGAVFVKADVTSPEEVADAVAAATQQPDPLAGVVHCAAITLAGKVLGRDGPHDQDAFLRALEVNVGGTFNVVRLAADALRHGPPGPSGERGVIVNTASIAAFDGQIGQAAYSASKGGVAAMTLPLARELARYGIRVVTIAPGMFETPMMMGLPAKARESLGTQIPFPSRLGDPAEYAGLVSHIVENQMLNGEVIRLDGGVRMSAQ